MIIAVYITMMYTTMQFRLEEIVPISSMAAISLVTYIYAIYIKPEYAQLPATKSDEQFLDLLKKVEDLPHKKVCAYCRIEKP